MCVCVGYAGPPGVASATYFFFAPLLPTGLREWSLGKKEAIEERCILVEVAGSGGDGDGDGGLCIQRDGTNS